MDVGQAYVVLPTSEQSVDYANGSQDPNYGESLSAIQKNDNNALDTEDVKHSGLTKELQEDGMMSRTCELNKHQMCNHGPGLVLKHNCNKLKLKEGSPFEINDHDIKDIKDFVEGKSPGSGIEYNELPDALEMNQPVFYKMRYKKKKGLGSNKNEPVKGLYSTNRAESEDEATRRVIRIEIMDEKDNEAAIQHLPSKENKRLKDQMLMENVVTGRSLNKHRHVNRERMNKEDEKIDNFQYQINYKKGGRMHGQDVDKGFVAKHGGQSVGNLKKNKIKMDDVITDQALVRGKYKKEPMRIYKEQEKVIDDDLYGRKQSTLNTAPSWVINDELAAEQFQEEHKRGFTPTSLRENMTERKHGLKKHQENLENYRDVNYGNRETIQANKRREEVRQDLRLKDELQNTKGKDNLVFDLQTPSVEVLDIPRSKTPRYESEQKMDDHSYRSIEKDRASHKSNIEHEGDLGFLESNRDRMLVTTPSSNEREQERVRERINDKYEDGEKVNLRRFKQPKHSKQSGYCQGRNTQNIMGTIPPERGQKKITSQNIDQEGFLGSRDPVKERYFSEFNKERHPFNPNDQEMHDMATKRAYSRKGTIVPIVAANKNDRDIEIQGKDIVNQREMPVDDVTNRGEVLNSPGLRKESLNHLSSYNDERVSNSRNIKPQPIQQVTKQSHPKGFLCKNEELSRKTQISVGTLPDILVEDSGAVSTTESFKPKTYQRPQSSLCVDKERTPSSLKYETLPSKGSNLDRVNSEEQSYNAEGHKKEQVETLNRYSGSGERVSDFRRNQYTTDRPMFKDEIIKFTDQDIGIKRQPKTFRSTEKNSLKDYEITESTRQHRFHDSAIINQKTPSLFDESPTYQPPSTASRFYDRAMEDGSSRYLSPVTTDNIEQISRNSREKFIDEDKRTADIKKDRGDMIFELRPGELKDPVNRVTDMIEQAKQDTSDNIKFKPNFHSSSMGPDFFNEFKDDVGNIGARNASLGEKKLTGLLHGLNDERDLKFPMNKHVTTPSYKDDIEHRLGSEGVEKFSVQSQFEAGIIKEDIPAGSPGLVTTTSRETIGGRLKGENFRTDKPFSVHQKINPTKNPSTFTSFYFGENGNRYIYQEITTLSDSMGRQGDNKKEALPNYGKQEARISTDFNGKDSINVMAMILPYVLPGMVGISNKLNELMSSGNKGINAKDNTIKNIGGVTNKDQQVTKGYEQINLLETHDTVPTHLMSDVKVIKSNKNNEDDIGIVAMIVPGLVTKQGKLTTSLTDLLSEGIKALNKEGHVRSDGSDLSNINNLLSEYPIAEAKNEKKEGKASNDLNKSPIKPTLCDDGSFYVIAKVKSSILKEQMGEHTNQLLLASTETIKDPLTEQNIVSTCASMVDSNKYGVSDSPENNGKTHFSSDSGGPDSAADAVCVTTKSEIELLHSLKCQRSIARGLSKLSSESQNPTDEHSPEDMIEVFNKQPEIYIQAYPENDFVKCTEKNENGLNGRIPVTNVSKRRRHISLGNVPFTGDKQSTLDSLKRLQDQLKNLEDGLKCLASTEETPNNLALQIKVCVDIVNGTSPSYFSTTPQYCAPEHNPHTSSLAIFKHLKQDINVPH